MSFAKIACYSPLTTCDCHLKSCDLEVLENYRSLSIIIIFFLQFVTPGSKDPWVLKTKKLVFYYCYFCFGDRKGIIPGIIPLCFINS